MAIYGSLGEVDLNALSASISDTAVDIFVYDTRKDSDGGAWRKRTQHTSWYNETLNTATRGSRREFPAVAVIIVTANEIRIYDGDDPDLPMWMVFNSDSDSNITNSMSTRDFTAVTAVNGWIFFSKQSTTGLTANIYGQLNFIFDGAEHIYAASAGALHYNVYNGSIGERNDAKGYTGIDNSLELVNADTDAWDIASTVLPNAPIDERTGLPTPTVAVATSDGVSVIKDDGTVVDLYVAVSGYDIVKKLSFTDDNKIAYTADVENLSRAFRVDSIPSSDLAVTSNQLQKQNSEEFYVTRDFGLTNGDLAYSNISNSQVNSLVKRNVAHLGGLSKIEKEEGGPRHAFVTSSFNTGWMHGDIKGAFLSDTDATNASETTNLASGFAFNATGRLTSHTYTSGATSWQMVDDPATNNGFVNIFLNGTTAGKQYLISLDVDTNPVLDSGYQHNVYSSVNSAPIKTITEWNGTGAGTLTIIYTSTHQGDSSNSLSDTFTFYSNNTTVNITNFTVREATESDRSVNNKSLAVYGTVTKSPVAGSGATAAELVAYSGWSASNYIEQPYNSDLDFGTGDFCVMGWYYINSNTNYMPLVCRGTGSGTGSNWTIRTNTGNVIEWYGGSSIIQSSTGGTNGSWKQICYVRSNKVGYLYIDGKLNNLGIDATSYPSEGVLRFGENSNEDQAYGSTNYFNGSLSLWRISKSAPSPEQIKKIYEDEKVLFQENAKCTLYGSSDAVTALAYDDSTNLLYAGTSSGRSDFQGLCRINNTTTAVTTAISASNGLIAEQ